MRTQKTSASSALQKVATDTTEHQWVSNKLQTLHSKSWKKSSGTLRKLMYTWMMLVPSQKAPLMSTLSYWKRSWQSLKKTTSQSTHPNVNGLSKRQTFWASGWLQQVSDHGRRRSSQSLIWQHQRTQLKCAVSLELWPSIESSFLSALTYCLLYIGWLKPRTRTSLIGLQHAKEHLTRSKLSWLRTCTSNTRITTSLSMSTLMPVRLNWDLLSCRTTNQLLTSLASSLQLNAITL